MTISSVGRSGLLALVAFLFAPVAAFAQTAPLAFEMKARVVDSGIHSALPSEASAQLAFATVIEEPGAPWLRLTFSDADLGAGSYLRLTSLFDGHQQTLDAEALAIWESSSAYFNGDAVELELFVAPGDRDVFVRMDEVMVGEHGAPESQCGPTDDRMSSDDPGAGRLLTIGCTAWLIGDDLVVSAGHCISSATSTNTLQFNVPPSTSGGTIQHPGPEDQYVVDDATRVFVNGGIGNDWGVFRVFDNTTTGMQPSDAQNACFTLAQDLGPANIRITGYGVDSGSDNQTQQTHVGPNAGSSGTVMRYQTDTEGGNSGSPVIDEATGNAVGVHTHGGCSTSGTGNNSGTSTFNTSFWGQIGTATCNGGGGDPITLNVTTATNPAGTRGRATLEWTPFDGSPERMEVLRDGDVIRTVRDEGSARDRLDPLPDGRLDYQVCDFESGECSNVVTVMFLDGLSADAWTTADELEASEESTAIVGAYPNPFNPTSTISYVLASRTEVELAVFNTLGQRVALLATGVQDAGRHDVRFEAGSLPSGVYIYTLSAGADVLTGRLMLVK